MVGRIGATDVGPGYHVPQGTARYCNADVMGGQRLGPGARGRADAKVRLRSYPRPVRQIIRVFGTFFLGIVLWGCAGSGPPPSFDPSGPCTSDGQRPGAYPQLERMIPAAFEGITPARIDSGRNCTERNLGTLAGHGIREVRFAGGLWETGERSGFTMAVLTAQGLTAERMADFYEAGARDGRKTEDVKRSTFDLDGRNAWMISTLNDESYQTIVVWDSTVPGMVRAVLVGSDVRETQGMGPHDDLVQRAVAAFAGP